MQKSKKFGLGAVAGLLTAAVVATGAFAGDITGAAHIPVSNLFQMGSRV